MTENWTTIAETVRNERLLKFLVDLATKPQLRGVLGVTDRERTRAESEALDALFEKYGLPDDDRGAIRAGSPGGILESLDNTQTAIPGGGIVADGGTGPGNAPK